MSRRNTKAIGAKPWPPSKIPGLDKAVERLKSMTPKERKKFNEEIRAAVRGVDQDRKDRENLTGKYDPENISRGRCLLCDGMVVEKVKQGYFGDPHLMILGPGSRNQMQTKSYGFYCKTCGLRYEFPPPAEDFLDEIIAERKKQDPDFDKLVDEAAKRQKGRRGRKSGA